MHSLSYRTKQRLHKALKIALIAVLVLILLLIMTVIYLQRFIVYTADGAHLDFDRSTATELPTEPTGETGETRLPNVSIVYVDPGGQEDAAAALSGYYIDYEMLKQPEKVLEALKALDAPCTVMVDLKSGMGNFFYSTRIDGARQADVDVAAVDEILSYLKSNGFSMIARVKSFQDTSFAEQHTESSLAVANGSLWVGNSNYWLNPDSPLVIDYLKQIAKELAGKGFKEIVFDDFYFPEGEQIVYTSEKSRTQLIADTATDLLNFFASSNITISFGNPATDFLPGNDTSHIFISGVDGSGVNEVAKGFSKLSSPEKQIVFLTGSRDTRFDGYQLLRPMI